MSANCPWTRKEIRAFWACAHKVAERIGRPAEEMVYDIVWQAFKKERLHELSRVQFLALLQRFKELAKDEVPGRLTAAQRAKIFALKAELNMSNQYLRAFCRRVTGVERVEWLSWKQARVLIGAMEKKLRYARRRRRNAV